MERAASTGKATLQFEGETHELIEVRCQTQRDEDGEVLGYEATFSDAVPVPTLHTGVAVSADYAGDATYDTSAFWERGAGYGVTAGGFAVMLTLTESGRRGVAESEDGSYRLEYQCGADDDVASKTRAPLGPPAPGTAHVKGTHGQWMVFEGLTCSRNPVSDEFVVEGPGDAGNEDLYRFYIILEATAPGRQEADMWFNYYGFDSTSGAQGDATLTCGDSITGTFAVTNAWQEVSGEFTCPPEEP